jgi:hypothetical protein
MSASNKKKLRKEQQAAAMTKKQQQAQKEAKSLKMYTLTFTVAMVLVVAIVIGIALSNPINGLINRKTVAVTINGHDLSIADLSYFYVDSITEEYNSIYSEYYSLYGQYASYFIPFSLSSPMDEQPYTGEGDFDTWADYFVHEAIDSAKSVYALYDMAMEANHELTATEKTALENYKSTLKSYATQQGYSSSASFLRMTYGNGCNASNYYDYFEASTYASSYYAAYKDSLEYDYEDYRAYEKDKYNEYSAYTYVYYKVNVTNYKGAGTKNEETGKVEYTKEELEKALADAKADAEALLAAAPKDKEAFDKAVAGLTINKDKKDVAATEAKAYPYSYLPKEIQEWIVNSERKEGDLTMVPIETENKDEDGKVIDKETTGFYVVLYNSREDYLDKMVSVRHILVKFEGGTKDDKTGETTYSPAEKKKAKDEADKIYKEWLDSTETDKEKLFGELANKNSDDQNGKVTNGGLYENIYKGQMTENFDKWCFDTARNPGDHDIIETEHGYHIVYFVKTQDLSYRDYLIELDLIAEACEKFLEDTKNSVTYTEGKLSRMEYDIIVYG